jgi:hypothetical protein
MLNIIIQSLLSLNCQALSWKCDYPTINGPRSTHFLYKEDNVNVVKWLEKYEYCRAKGDSSVYIDAGKGKCEYSRNICVFYNNQCIINENRGNDPLQECQDLLTNNIISYELDSGRIKEEPTEEEPTEEEPTEEEPTEEEPTEEEPTEEEPTEEEQTEEPIEEVPCEEEIIEEIEEEILEEIEEEIEEEILEEEILEEETEEILEEEILEEPCVEEEEIIEEEIIETEEIMISAGKSNKISLLIFLLFVG